MTETKETKIIKLPRRKPEKAQLSKVFPQESRQLQKKKKKGAQATITKTVNVVSHETQTTKEGKILTFKLIWKKGRRKRGKWVEEHLICQLEMRNPLQLLK